ncbi:unnamed protein product [Nippostrongylus brasiliensis]|uniref:Reverse transcriptase domain-containing protein n=1 Tax=Nippostrongylus brasiliensis TaxID=27835 RepID=A0A0N4YYF2_NIPBR|nr:unnamed protein product [Nippostrongylus brasiliensis]
MHGSVHADLANASSDPTVRRSAMILEKCWLISARHSTYTTGTATFSSRQKEDGHTVLRMVNVHELDHIMCNRKVFTDVRLTQIRQKQTRIKRIDIEALQSMMDSVSFDMFGDIDEDYSRITNIITTLANGTRTTSRTGIESTMANFYTNLFRTRHGTAAAELPAGDDVPPFMTSEVRLAVETMSKGKSPGSDGITVEMLLACGQKLFSALAQRFTRYVTMCEIPAAWKRSKTILLFKKGDKEDLANYRPITLLPVLYKVFSRCLLSRRKRTLDEEQPIEQAGFRRKFSTLDHTLTCCRVIEAARE